MEVRGAIAENSKIVATAAGVVALVAFAYVVWNFASPTNPAPSKPEPLAYFYDLHTDELFTAPANSKAPLDRPGGPYNGHPAGVRAKVFACGQCSDASKRFIGWLEIDGPSIGKPPASEEDEAIYIRRPDDAEWVSLASPEGKKLTDGVLSGCGEDTRVNFCYPSTRRVKNR